MSAVPAPEPFDALHRRRQALLRFSSPPATAHPDLVDTDESRPSLEERFSSRAKRVLQLALRVALSLGHTSIETGDLLLGLLRENEGVAARVLAEVDITYGDAKERIREIHGVAQTQGAGEALAELEKRGVVTEKESARIRKRIEKTS